MSKSRPAGSLSASTNTVESNGSSSRKAEMTTCVSLIGPPSSLAAGLPHRNGSSGRDWSRQGLELESSAMDARSDGVPRQSARTSDFFIAKAGDFPHEKYVSVEVCQGGEPPR